MKYKLNDGEYIFLDSTDIERVARYDNTNERSVLFALIVLGRYKKQYGKNKNTWVKLDIKQLFKIANVSMRKVDKYRILHKLYVMGEFEQSFKKSSSAVMINNLSDNTDAKVIISSLDDLGLLCRELFGERFIYCNECGKKVKQRSNSQKYCGSCYKKLHKH